MPIRLFPRRFFLASLFALLCGIAHTQPPPPAGQFSRLPKRGIPATDLTTISGADIPIRSALFDTPPDLSDMIRGTATYDYDYEALATSEGFAFEQIKTISLRPVAREWVESDAERIEVLDLGPMGRALPPPPDWQRSFGNQPAWTRARAVKPGALVPYVNRAQYVWSAEEPGAEGRELLIRQSFDVLSAHEIIASTLRIAGRAEIVSAALNDHPIHLAGDTQFGHAEFEISPLIRSGQNILAVWVRPQTGAGARAEPPAIGWHIELSRMPGRDEKFRNQWGQALLVTLEGDRVWGRLDAAGESTVRLATEYGGYEAEWDQIESVNFPRGWTDVSDPANRGMAKKIASWWNERGKPRLTDALGVGLPLRLAPRGLAGHVLLSEGRALPGRPVGATDEEAQLVDDRGQRFTVKLAEVFAIHPPGTGIPPMQKPKTELASLYCRVTTHRGERISGLLRQMNRSGLVVEAPGGDFLRMPAREVVGISFPYHGLLGTKPPALSPDGATPPQIGILGRAQGTEDSATEFNRISAQLQHAAFLAGLACAMIPQPMMTDSLRLAPEYFPVLACLDPLGEYLDSLNTPGDTRTVLRQYVERGGVLLLYSRGGALRTEVKTSPDGMARSPSTQGLARDLGLRVALPGDPVPSGVNPFDRPPNQSLPMEFVRGPAFADALAELPSVIELGNQMIAPFYPMISNDPVEQGVIHELRMDGAMRYGPGLQAVSVGRGRVVVIDHLLWSSRVDGQPFEVAVLPVLLRWAFGR